jgi:molybdate transport system ATP-binding protein
MSRFDCDFTLQQGSFALEFRLQTDARAVALFGPSGSGKTTALEVLAGLRQPHGGRAAIGGRLLFDRAAHVSLPARSRRVGYVPQDVLLFPHLNVGANVRYGRPESAPAAAIVELLELQPLMDRRVGSLSGGERQRVAIGRALHAGPEVLLLDEPLAAVDLPRRTRIVSSLLRIRDELNVPLVYVTHSPEEARAIAEYAVVLDGGRVVAQGPGAEVLKG